MRTFRKIISTLIFLFIGYIVLFDTFLLSRKIIPFIEFGPSLVSDIKIGGMFIIGAVVVLTLTALFGRLFCSFLCPLGFLMDISIFISKKTVKLKMEFIKPKRIIKYTIMGITISCFAVGITSVLSFLEPFSINGRILTNVFKPIGAHIYNAISYGLGRMGNFVLEPFTMYRLSVSAVVISIVYLFFIGIMAFFKGRLYCNTICPVGAILSVFSIKPLFAMRIEKDRCNSCGKCKRSCKGMCIDTEEKKVYSENCVMCFNCTVCPTGAMKFSKEEIRENNSKREFLKSAGISFGVLSGLSAVKIWGQNGKNIGSKNDFPVVPPGSKSLDHFRNFCTGCNICVNKCPTGVIKPSLFEYGIEGMMQPYLDFSKNFCQFECNECSKVCPTNAITSITKEVKKTTQIGRVNLIKEKCIVYKEKRDCGACSEHCPTKAVYMVEYEGNYRAPETDANACIGCGACEYICPVVPDKAIKVKPLREHGKAVKRENKEKVKLNMEEFPF